jgi:hypothetical protein
MLASLLFGVSAADNVLEVVGSLLFLSRVPDVADAVLLLSSRLLLVSLLSYAWRPSVCINICRVQAQLLDYRPIGQLLSDTFALLTDHIDYRSVN